MYKYWYNHDTRKLHRVPPEDHHIDFAFHNPHHLNFSAEQHRDVEAVWHKMQATQDPSIPPDSAFRNNTRVTVLPTGKSIEFHHSSLTPTNLYHSQDILDHMQIPNHWDVYHVSNDPSRIIRTTATDTRTAKNFRELDPPDYAKFESLEIPAELFEASQKNGAHVYPDEESFTYEPGEEYHAYRIGRDIPPGAITESEEKVCLPSDEFEKEHKHLVKVLRSGSKKDRDQEADRQEKELSEADYSIQPGCKELEEDLHEGRYVYHGTSSKFLPDILKNGLEPGNLKSGNMKGLVYVTRDPEIARREAGYTVHGDFDGEREGVGGHQVVLKIDRSHPSMRKAKFFVDDHYHDDDPGIHSVHSFATSSPIHPEAITVHQQFRGGRPKDPVLKTPKINIPKPPDGYHQIFTAHGYRHAGTSYNKNKFTHTYAKPIPGRGDHMMEVTPTGGWTEQVGYGPGKGSDPASLHTFLSSRTESLTSPLDPGSHPLPSESINTSEASSSTEKTSNYSWAYSLGHGVYTLPGFHRHNDIGNASIDHREREPGVHQGWAKYYHNTKHLVLHSYTWENPPDEVVKHFEKLHRPKSVNVVHGTRSPYEYSRLLTINPDHADLYKHKSESDPIDALLAECDEILDEGRQGRHKLVNPEDIGNPRAASVFELGEPFHESLGEGYQRPPNLKLAENPERSCGTCGYFSPCHGNCDMYGGYPVNATQVCSEYVAGEPGTMHESLDESDKTRYLYHGTSSIYLDQIKREGLKPGARKHPDHEPRVHVTTDPGVAAEEADLPEDDFTKKAHAFHQEFAKHPSVGNVHTHLIRGVRDPRYSIEPQADIGGDYVENGEKKGEFHFYLSNRWFPGTQGKHPTAVFNHFYADDRKERQKGGMSKLLDDYIEGAKKLGVTHALVIGGTRYWQRPAARHQDLHWVGYDTNTESYDRLAQSIEEAQDFEDSFGFVDPEGREHWGEASRDFNHDDLARRLGHHGTDDALAKGWIRFYHNSDETGLEYQDDHAGIHRRAARFLRGSPKRIHVDVRKYNPQNSGGTESSNDFQSSREAIQHLMQRHEASLQDLQTRVESFDASDLEALYGHEFSHPEGSTHPVHQVLTKHGWTHDSTYKPSDPRESRYTKQGQNMFVSLWHGVMTHDDDPRGETLDLSKFHPGLGQARFIKHDSTPHWIHQGGGHGSGAPDLDSYLTHIHAEHLYSTRVDHELSHGREVLANNGWKPTDRTNLGEYYTHPDWHGHVVGLHRTSDGVNVSHKTPKNEWLPFNVQTLSGHLNGAKTGVWSDVENS